MTKIDVFPHILPKPYFDKMLSMSSRSAYMQSACGIFPLCTISTFAFALWSSIRITRRC